MSIARYERYRRTARSAGSWVKRAIAVLLAERERASDAEKWLIGYEVARLLDVLLWDGESLVPLLNDDADFDTLRRHAREMGEALRRRELAVKVAGTAGRTPEEAALFEAKAAEFRGRT